MSSGWRRSSRTTSPPLASTSRAHPRRLATVRLVVLHAVLLAYADRGAAEDRVVLQPSGQGSRISVSGVIQDYNGRELVLLTGVGGGIKRFPFDEVIEITTNYNPAHQEGRKQLAAGQFEDAWKSLDRALQDEDRGWVRREILASQVKAAYGANDYSRAATRFLAIALSDPVTPHYRLMPLVWTEQTPASASPSDARRWLQDAAMPARLIGASWLLQGRDEEQAQQVMRSLAGESHPFIQRLAQAQLWRVRLEQGDVLSAELQRWERFVEGLPTPLRGGPYFAVGRGYAQRQEWLAAAAAWMWLPIEYSEQRDLAVEAQLRASQAMAAAGDAASAYRLAQELVIRYADTPQAAGAREVIDQAAKTVAPVRGLP